MIFANLIVSQKGSGTLFGTDFIQPNICNITFGYIRKRNLFLDILKNVSKSIFQREKNTLLNKIKNLLRKTHLFEIIIF